MTGVHVEAGDGRETKRDPFKPLDKNSSVLLGSGFKIIDPPKRAPKPPLKKPEDESRSILLEMREQATKVGVPWSLDESASDIRVSIAFYRDKEQGVHKRGPKFFEPLLSDPDTKAVAARLVPEMSEEEKLAALSKRHANPLHRVHASCMNMGLPFGKYAVTTNKAVNAVTDTSRRNPKLMQKLALIDESAQRLQAMLRDSSASVPGQQIPDKARILERKMRKAEFAETTLKIATKDFSRRD